MGEMGTLCSWNILAGHDTMRLRHELPDASLRRMALIAQFTFPGVPLIYYGEEIGMDGGKDPDNRRTMRWDRQDWRMEEFEFYKSLIRIRKARRELREGVFINLTDNLSGDTMAFLRHGCEPDELSVIVLNNSDEPLTKKLLIPYSHLYDGLLMENLLSAGGHVVVEFGGINLSLAPKSGMILVPKEHESPNYRFFRKRALS